MLIFQKTATQIQNKSFSTECKAITAALKVAKKVDEMVFVEKFDKAMGPSRFLICSEDEARRLFPDNDSIAVVHSDGWIEDKNHF